MPSKMGRPPKSGESKKVSLQLRITKTTADQLERCAAELQTSRTEVIEKLIHQFYEDITTK